MITLDPFMASAPTSGIQRGRGGFLRSKDGAPYVSDPSGTTVASGARRGEVRRLKYGSPSGAGTLIENDVGLTKHKQRNTFLGIGMSEELREACRALVDMDHGSEAFTKAADSIVIEADKLTRSWLAADRGTHGHLLCELWDKSNGHLILTPEQAAAGELVGLDAFTQTAVVGAWHNLLAHNGLEILAVESSCVDDRWRLAGTLDRLVRTTRPLSFARAGGEIVTVPSGVVIVLDLKFGKTRKAHPIQIASYAQSVPYDTETETRGEWPWEIDQTHALIAHGDFGDDTRPPSIELVWVDLAAGRDHGGECVVQAKAWAARDDVFSVAMLPADVPVGVEPSAAARNSTGATLSGEDKVTPVPLPTSPAPSSAGAPEPSAPLTAGEAACGKQSPTSPAMTPEEYARRYTNEGVFVSTIRALTPDPDRLALVDARAKLATAPTQGADLTDDEFAPLWDMVRGEYQALDPAARSWIGELSSKATRQQLSFHTMTTRTERSYCIARALVSLCQSGCARDEVLRALLALLVGDVALFVGVHPGHVVGSLNHTEAERLCLLVDAFTADRLIGDVDEAGIYRLRETAA